MSGLTSNSLSTIPLNRLAVLDDPLPDPLPPGETTVTLKLVLLGTYALNLNGDIEFSPEPSREELLLSSSSVDSRKPPEQLRTGQAEKLRRRLLGSHSTWDDPVVIQRGPKGKPEAVWMRKNAMSSLPGYTAPQVELDK